MNINTKQFLVQPESDDLKLADLPTEFRKIYKSKHDYQDTLDAHRDELANLQQLFYADGTNAMLLIFQGMDTSGKDGAIKHVFSGVNPQGCSVHSFQKPSAEDLKHDFLWRTSKVLPERGQIGIFNRSYYEEVLVVRVHPELLHLQRLPEKAIDDKLWKKRFEDIVAHEEHLSRNGTTIIKFFLNISKAEQKERLMKRLEDETRNWKFSDQDIAERKFWDEYMKAYEECLRNTSSKFAPWYVIPADDKKNARLLISQIVIEHMNELEMSFPAVDADRKRQLKAIRKALEGDS